MLVEIGYKEIDVAFPGASQIEFDFCRKLVETPGAVPEDVWLQVLSPCRKDLIRRTVDSVSGCKRAILSLYIATSDTFIETIFGSSQQDVLDKAVDCIKFARSITKDDELQSKTTWSLCFSPEAFTDTDINFSVRLCEAVKEVWEPTEENKIILNLPATVEMGSPNTYADQVEIFKTSLTTLERVCVSLHPHNDRGCAVAAAELGQLAGAERVEGCLFGNGERTGNVDLVTLALNLYVQGIDPQIDFSDLKSVRAVAERCTGIKVHTRAPYSGDSTFVAYSGSHQDAINKAFMKMDRNGLWKVPYLSLDPRDIGCTYKELVQVNSQSGKGGVAWSLRQVLQIELPRGMQVDFSSRMKVLTVRNGGTIPPEEIANFFLTTYGLFSLDQRVASARIHREGEYRIVEASVIIHNHTSYLKGRGETTMNAVTDAFSAAGYNVTFSSSTTTLFHLNQLHMVSLVECRLSKSDQKWWGASLFSAAEEELSQLKASVLAAMVRLRCPVPDQ